MYTKIAMALSGMLLLGGCATGDVSLGVSNAHGARTSCEGQAAHRQMTEQREQQFMHRCMSGYGYGSDTRQSKPFKVPMPTHDQQQQ